MQSTVKLHEARETDQLAAMNEGLIRVEEPESSQVGADKYMKTC